MSDEEKTREAQFVYDSVLKAFPNLQRLMVQAQAFATRHGYVETILGRRRHLPDMMLDEFEFEPMADYVNPDIDPLDPDGSAGSDGIPPEKVETLKAEFAKFRYLGQVARRTKELYEKEHIRVKNNRSKITDAKRQCVNCVDLDTEILTSEGWKRHDEVEVGDLVVAYDMEDKALCWDVVKEVIHNDGKQQAYWFHNNWFDAVSTPDHRWVMLNYITREETVYSAKRIFDVKSPRYNILRMADSAISDGVVEGSPSADEVIAALSDGTASAEYVLGLPKEVAVEVIHRLHDERSQYGCVTFPTREAADLFQMVGVAAGRTLNMRRERYIRATKGIDTEVFKVSCPDYDKFNTAKVLNLHKEPIEVEGTWCVSTETTTWVARRNGKPYITGNSIIQGSAADFTKMALLKVAQDPRWYKYGGKILTVVHDEIIAQAPEDCWREAADVLKEDMEESGRFLPFSIACDVEATWRWYGLGVEHDYKKPASVHTGDPDEIKWIQYNLVESEYELPVFNGPDGKEPRGDAAHGVNGQRSPEMESAIAAYCAKYQVSEEDFLDDIDCRVHFGAISRN